MPNVNDLKKSNFLTKNDCDPAILVTIRSYEEVNVAKDGAPQEMRWALHFDECDKPMVLNSTNGQIIASITKSDDFDAWIGAKVVLYHDPNISFGGKLVGGIRVRAPKNQAPKPAPAPAPKPAPVQPSDNDGDNETPF
jgi:hypothetical protein